MVDMMTDMWTLIVTQGFTGVTAQEDSRHLLTSLGFVLYKTHLQPMPDLLVKVYVACPV